jgi:hypothetical protein
METLVTESDKTVRNKISDAVAELARQYYDNSASPNKYSPQQPLKMLTLSQMTFPR